MCLCKHKCNFIPPITACVTIVWIEIEYILTNRPITTTTTTTSYFMILLLLLQLIFCLMVSFYLFQIFWLVQWSNIDSVHSVWFFSFPVWTSILGLYTFDNFQHWIALVHVILLGQSVSVLWFRHIFITTLLDIRWLATTIKIGSCVVYNEDVMFSMNLEIICLFSNETFSFINWQWMIARLACFLFCVVEFTLWIDLRCKNSFCAKFEPHCQFVTRIVHWFVYENWFVWKVVTWRNFKC